jgi:type IV secretion system protein VirB2
MRNSFTNYIRPFLGFMTFITALFFSFSVAAADTSTDPTGIVTVFCNVINQITGGIGKVISVLILISMAIGLFLGKITWGLAISVMVGMGILFGAAGLVDLMTTNTNTTSTTTQTTEQLCANTGTST